MIDIEKEKRLRAEAVRHVLAIAEFSARTEAEQNPVMKAVMETTGKAMLHYVHEQRKRLC